MGKLVFLPGQKNALYCGMKHVQKKVNEMNNETSCPWRTYAVTLNTNEMRVAEFNPTNEKETVSTRRLYQTQRDE